MGPTPKAPLSATVDFFGDHAHDHHPGHHPYGHGHHGHTGVAAAAPVRTPTKADKKRKRAEEVGVSPVEVAESAGSQGKKKGERRGIKVSAAPKPVPAADEISAFR